MPVAAGIDGSEDVNDFLLRIRELGDQRDKEDEERTRKLEEEIIQGRKERQARRAERARSLSPTKDASPHSGTPSSLLSNHDRSMVDDLSRTPSLPQPSQSQRGRMDDPPRKLNGASPKSENYESSMASRELSQPPVKTHAMSSTSPSAAAGPSRSNTLSWQQRPSSRGSTGSVRSRPLSVVASENNASRSVRSTEEPATEDADNVPRSQIAQSLGSKDPSWFKQTQERGLGSAAYRRNQEEDAVDTSSMSSGLRLPGMSRKGTAGAETRVSSPPEGSHSTSPSREGSFRGTTGHSNDCESSASVSFKGGFWSPLPSSNRQRFEPPPSDTISFPGSEDTSSAGRSMAMSPSQGRLSPERMERPPSPTKGLGGFVQSAMMKRSDSVNKRWSAQGGPGLSRGDSVASNRGGLDGIRYPVGGVTPIAESRNSLSREATPNVNSRPTSSHSNTTTMQSSVVDTRPFTGTTSPSRPSKAPSSVQGPVSPHEERRSTPPVTNTAQDEPMMSPPASPSKRWSPTKSSWLENAISKPESPKVLSPAVAQQPAWMVDMNRAKQQRSSVDLSKGPAFKEVSTGGLIRSPPPGTGYKSPTIGGLPSGFSSGVALKPRTGGSEDYPRTGSPELKMNDTEKVPGEASETGFSYSRSSPPSASLKSPQKASKISSGPTTKPKPETPPKKDFRTTLKPRQSSSEARSKDEPEFKNVFGKLKKTQTQNYVAPDELKDNILRGKAGLALTGGPKKTELKDEFKESILEKKGKMVAPSASTRITSASSKNPERSIPEAIAKRRDLARSESALSSGTVEAEKSAPKPEALTKLEIVQDKPKILAPEQQNSAPARVQQDPQPKKGLGGNFASSLAGMLQRGPSPVIGGAINVPSKFHDPTRFSGLAAGSAERDQEPGAGPQLTHTTKARARGPKRKPPTTAKNDNTTSPTGLQKEPSFKQNLPENKPPTITQAQKPQQSPDRSNPKPLSIITNNSNNNRKASQPVTPRQPSTSISQPLSSKPTPVIGQSPVLVTAAKPVSIAAPKPQTPTVAKTQKPAISAPKSPVEQAHERTTSTDPLPKAIETQLSSTSDGSDAQQPLPSVKGAAALWGQTRQPAQASGPRSPVKLPTRKDEEAAMASAGLGRKDLIGLGIETPIRASQLPHQEAPSPSTNSPRSPLPSKKPEGIENVARTPTFPSPAIRKRSTSPLKKQPSQSSMLLTDIFDEPPSSKGKINVDTQAVLDARISSDSSQKIKTLRKEVFEVLDNGKIVPVPAQQEHILFEDSLYLCTHVYGSPAGTRTTEVYLWSGDGVPPSAVEDAQLFAKKTAKDSGGKLMLLKQGKETSNFFQALGGIVITRKGSSNRSDSAIYMLCGRQHLGQIAFDEVDFSVQSLCQGFPYIVSARGGRLYLWKGIGAGADELGCARLIGMDLGLTGEIEEIDEGKEPKEFWTAFPSGKPKEITDAQHWHLKPSCENYATKLFSVDVETPRPKSSSGFMSWGRRGSVPASEASGSLTAQVKEITPFSQADLVDDNIFVLDAFFEIFVIHPLRTSLTPAPQHRSTKSNSFRAALLFAQEYGILAASAEDRPFVPQSSVVIISKEGDVRERGESSVPEGVKRAFRKWDGGAVGGGGCRVLSLTEALGVEEE